MCEIAWAAGFFDGEGTSYSARNGGGKYRRYKAYLRLQAVQKHRGPLDRLHEALGCVGTVRRQNERMFIWNATGRPAEAAASLLRPYLTDIKIAQLDAAIERVRAFNNNN